MNKKACIISFVIYYGFIASYFILCYANPIDYFVSKCSDMNETEQMLWVFLFLPVWCFSYFASEQEFSIGKIAIYRYKKINIWWKKLHIKNLLFLSAVYGGLLMIIGASSPFHIVIKIWIVLCIHALFLYEMGIIIWVVTKKIILSAILIIILEGAGYSLINSYGIKPCFYPFCWGMYGFNVIQFGEGGFLLSFTISLQILIIILAVFSIEIKKFKILVENLILNSLHTKE